MKYDFNNKTVVLTGATGGIGAEIARILVEKYGCKVYGVGRNRQKAEAVKQSLGEKSSNFIPVFADVTNRDDYKIFDRIENVDVLINNAGIAQISLFTDINDEEWERMLAVNLSGVFYTTRAVLPSMISQKSGRIINIGSMWGKCGASCEVHYSSTKAGIRGMTMALAKEVGPSGITVNCIEPGVIDTDMNAELSEDELRELADETPLCRIGKPLDVAHLAEFLASEKASFITGQIIGVDGGYAI